MARKTSATPTRIWKFGARPPTENAARVDELLELASRYFERLTTIERGRYRRYQAIRREAVPELAELERAYESCQRKIRDLIREAKASRCAVWRETDGKRTLELPEHVEAQLQELRKEAERISKEARPHVDAFHALLAPARKAFEQRSANLPQDLVDRIEEVKQELKRARREKTDTSGLSQELAELNARKRSLAPAPNTKAKMNELVLQAMLGEDWPKAWKEIAISDKEASDARKKARAECGLPPGTYLQVETAFDRAKQDALPEQPRFYSHNERFDGRGKIAVQMTSETFADVVSGRSRRLQLTRSILPGARGKQEQYWIARIQIARNAQKSSEWVAFPVKLDRLPPEDAVLKWAWVTVRKRGEQRVYELQLVMEHGSFGAPKRPAGVGHGGHVRIGWGTHPEGICVAKWEDGEVVVPHAILDQGEHAAILRGHADEHFHGVKRALRLWLRRSPNRLLYWDRIVGDARRLQFRRLCSDYAVSRFGDEGLRELWQQWRRDRLSAGRDLFAYLRVADRWIRKLGHTDQRDRMAWWLFLWARKDAHLRQYSADSLRRFEARRDQFFHNEAIRIATRYETICVDSYNISSLKKMPELVTAGAARLHVKSRHNLQLAAPGRFREILLETMGDRCVKSERPSDNGSASGSRKGTKDASKRQQGPRKGRAEAASP